MRKTWTIADINYLKENLGKKKIEEIAAHLDRSVTSVNLFVYRRKMPIGQTVKRNIMRNLLDIKFGSYEYFSPNRTFFRAVRINQKRWSLIIQGYKQATQQEVTAVAEHFRLSSEEAINLMSSCQLDIFDESKEE